MALESESLNLDLGLTVTLLQQSDTQMALNVVFKTFADHDVLMVDILVKGLFEGDKEQRVTGLQ